MPGPEPVEPLVLGVDLGTQGVRAELVDSSGALLGSGAAPLATGGRTVDGRHEQDRRTGGLPPARPSGADALVTHLAPVTTGVLEAGRGRLRVVGVTRGGPVNVDLGAAARAGGRWCTCPGGTCARSPSSPWAP